DGSHLGSAYLLCPGGCRAGCAQPAGSPALRQLSAAGDRLTRPTTVQRQAKASAAGHGASPPLAWLPGSDQPTKQAGMATPEPHRAPPALSGVGSRSLGAHDNRVIGNRITGNVPSGETEFSGGVAVVTDFLGTAPAN